MVYNQYIFEFDPEKAQANLIKHGIDFGEAQGLWAAPHIEFKLTTEGEPRWAIIGIIANRFWTAIITKRSGKIRIISVRRSRREEKQIYKSRFKEED